VSLANIKEVLYLVNRPGNAPSHAGAAQWIDKAIELVAPPPVFTFTSGTMISGRRL